MDDYRFTVSPRVARRVARRVDRRDRPRDASRASRASFAPTRPSRRRLSIAIAIARAIARHRAGASIARIEPIAIDDASIESNPRSTTRRSRSSSIDRSIDRCARDVAAPRPHTDARATGDRGDREARARCGDARRTRETARGDDARRDDDDARAIRFDSMPRDERSRATRERARATRDRVDDARRSRRAKARTTTRTRARRRFDARAVAACAAWWRARGRGARGYTHASDVGLLAVGVPSTTTSLGTTGGVDVFGLNFPPGSSAAASVPGQLRCVFGGSPGESYDASVIAGTTGVRCDTPSGREGFVALGLSSNGGVDAVLFHELGMSSVVNFVREMNGVLTRSSPHVATEGDVSRLTGRNALPKDGSPDIVGRARECEWRGATSGGFEVSYAGMGVYVSSALVMCEVPRFAAPSTSAEEASMYSFGESRVALVERINLDALAITSKDKNATHVTGGIGVDVTVAGILGAMFTDDGAPYVRFGAISVAASASNAYTITVIAPAMAPATSKDVWVAAVPSMNSGKKSAGATLDVVDEFYGVVSASESGTLPTTYSWSADPYPTFSLSLLCVTQGVGETATSTSSACLHDNQLATGFVTVMMSYHGRDLPTSRPHDSDVVLKITATPTTSSVSPARGPSEGGAVVWVTGNNFHETVRAGDGAVPRCSFGVDKSGSSLGSFVSSALIACETPYVGTVSSSVQVIVAGSSLAAVASGPKYSFMGNTLVYQHSIAPHLGPTYGGTRVVFTLGNSVAATSMTSCRFGSIVVNGWTPLVTTDANADAGIVCVAPALKAGTYNLGLGTVRGAVGDSTTSPVTLGTMPYVVYAESA